MHLPPNPRKAPVVSVAGMHAHAIYVRIIPENSKDTGELTLNFYKEPYHRKLISFSPFIEESLPKK